jgi:hypothetical protein
VLRKIIRMAAKDHAFVKAFASGKVRARTADGRAVSVLRLQSNGVTSPHRQPVLLRVSHSTTGAGTLRAGPAR